MTSAQLGDAGVDRSAVTRRVRAGRLHRLHRGVYAVGHWKVSREGWWMAAVLASGDGAALSHGAAAALWGLLRPIGGPIDVTVPTHGGKRRRGGIRIHRCVSLDGARSARLARETRPVSLVTTHDRIPVTTVQRTIDDLRGGGYAAKLVRRAIRQAELKGYRLAGVEGDRSRSDLERDFLAFCRRHRFPAPEVNVKVGQWRVDFLWSAERLVVETDFFHYHRGSVAYEDDHDRDFGLRRLGFVVYRYTGDQLRRKPAEIAAELGEALRADPVPGGRGRGARLARLPAS